MTDRMFIDRAIGIDLGTTNSAVALLDPSESDIVVWADRFGRQIVPSALAWDEKQEKLLVGRTARNRRGKTPPPLESIKRHMGHAAKLHCGPLELGPEEASSKILAELRDLMRERLAEAAAEGIEVRVTRAVITVPAYFDAPQVEATRRAGELAGLDVIGILQEPTAAAIYHTWKRRLGDGCFLVYDLGGGTFDVSILRCVGGEYQVLAIDGDNYLGGDDLDRRFAEHLRKSLVARGYALSFDQLGKPEDRLRFQQLVHLAQEIKESLSTADVVPVSRQNVLEDDAGEPVSVEAEIGRAEYEAAVADLVERTIDCCNRALERSREVAGVGREQIDHVVLVGGSTRVPLVVKRVIEAVASGAKSPTPLQDEVDTCVALGAAVHAAQVGGLRVGRADGRATVHFTTPLVTRGGELRLGLRVESAPDGATEVAVLRDEQAIATAPLAPGETLRLVVPIASEGENRLRLALRREGASLAEVPFALYRGDVRPRASGLSQPSVVAKDISIEVARGGRRERRVLLARGAGLPSEAQHRFYTGDQSGAVVLRLLQERLPIKTLMLEVPGDLPVGSPVDLELRCDEAMRLEARARVGQQDLWVRIEPPAEQELDPSGTVQSLLIAAEEVERSLWGIDAHLFRREAEPLLTGVREVVATDPAKLAALCARLRLLIEEFRGRGEQGELSPPMHRFTGLLDDLRRIVYRSATTLMGMDRAAWDERIARLDERGRDAWDRNDAPAWRRAYNEAQALLETASQEEFASMRLDDPAYLQRSMQRVVFWTNRLERALGDFVPSATDDVRKLQLAERDRLLRALADGVAKPLAGLAIDQMEPAELRRTLERYQDELNRIEDALERIPSLGLVTERG